MKFDFPAVAKARGFGPPELRVKASIGPKNSMNLAQGLLNYINGICVNRKDVNHQVETLFRPGQTGEIADP